MPPVLDHWTAPTGKISIQRRFSEPSGPEAWLTLGGSASAHVTEEIVLWITFGNVHDAAGPLRAIRSCVSVAAAHRV